MLASHESLWEKPLSDDVELLLGNNGYIDSTNTTKSVNRNATRKDKTKIVTFRAPHNTAVQVFDFKSKEKRIVYGPGIVIL